MIKILIDEKAIEVEEGTTVFKAAKQAGIHIPHLCYHPAFAPEGTCRMCLVEIEGLPKLELACSTVVREGMKVSTRNEQVDTARKGVLEFILAEHPLDCPICDKAGECKLQDYYDEYGLFDSSFKEAKEKREKKIKIGKSLIHDLERCVLCRRCVRFLREITKTQEMGVFERGIHAEVNILDENPIDNNYSGNLAQICPVGAITDTDFRFKTRTWFLKDGDSICPLCSRGCNISIEYLNGFSRFPVAKRVYRIKARKNQEINGFWICDYGRYGYSHLDDGRLDHIIVKNEGDKTTLNWENVLRLIAEKINKMHSKKEASRITLILNSFLSNEELFIVKKLFKDDLKVEKIFFADPPKAEADDYLLTSERTPNRRGAQELGFDFNPVKVESLSDETELLLLFGSFIHDHPDAADVKAALKTIETTVLFGSHSNEIDSNADIVLPVSLIAEKSGSLTNLDGVVQKFFQVFEAPGECRPEWEVLVNLAKEVGTDSKYYSQFSSPEVVSQAMRKEIHFFGKKSE